MTKAEAFEYLKGKRVACDCYNKEDVQRKLFKVGIRWRGGLTEVINSALFLFIDVNGCLTHCNSRIWFDFHEYEEISADDILSIEIVEGTPKFSYEKVVELAKPLMEYLNDTGCTEQIGVSYDCIVARPMAIFLHGEMKGC